MATVDLGRIKFVWQGTWSSSTAYVVDDVVYNDGSAYVCILASTNNEPPNATYWNVMAQGSDLGSISGLAAGDIVYYTGSAWARLGIGSATEILQVNSGATALEYTTQPEGKVKQIVTGTATGITTGSRNTSNDSTFSGNIGNKHVTVNITPTSTTSTIVMMATAPMGVGTNDLGHAGIYYGTGSSSVCVAAANANGYSADASGVSLSGFFTSGTTSQIETSFRIIGTWSGNTAALGSKRGTNSSITPYGNLILMEIE